MTDKTVPIVRSGPRKAEPKRLMPRPAGWRAWLHAPVVCVAMVLFLIGASIALLGVCLTASSDVVLEWLSGGDEA